MPEQAPLQKLVEQHTLDLIGVGVGKTQSWVEREERAVKGRAGEGNEYIQSTWYDILKKNDFFLFKEWYIFIQMKTKNEENDLLSS